jgi:hypothetical protein
VTILPDTGTNLSETERSLPIEEQFCQIQGQLCQTVIYRTNIARYRGSSAILKKNSRKRQGKKSLTDKGPGGELRKNLLELTSKHFKSEQAA